MLFSNFVIMILRESIYLYIKLKLIKIYIFINNENWKNIGILIYYYVMTYLK